MIAVGNCVEIRVRINRGEKTAGSVGGKRACLQACDLRQKSSVGTINSECHWCHQDLRGHNFLQWNAMPFHLIHIYLMLLLPLADIWPGVKHNIKSCFETQLLCSTLSNYLQTKLFLELWCYTLRGYFILMWAGRDKEKRSISIFSNNC